MTNLALAAMAGALIALCAVPILNIGGAQRVCQTIHSADTCAYTLR